MSTKPQKSPKEVLSELIRVDDQLWAIVEEIRDLDLPNSDEIVNALMRVRGELHIRLMRPIYSENPDLERLVDGENHDERSN